MRRIPHFYALTIPFKILDFKYNKHTYQYMALDMEMPVHNIGANLVYDWTVNKKLAKAALTKDGKMIGSFYYILKDSGSNVLDSEAILTYQTQEIINWKGNFVFTDTKKTVMCHLQGSLIPTSVKLKGKVTRGVVEVFYFFRNFSKSR